MKTLPTLGSLRRITFWQHHANGHMTVFPVGPEHVPFEIQRVFTIAGVSEGGVRANHAHRRCNQMLACLSGSITVRITDSLGKREETLGPDGVSLLIPPMLWNSVVFDGPTTVLAVFCDELYDNEDYIRDWDEFIRLRGTSGGET